MLANIVSTKPNGLFSGDHPILACITQREVLSDEVSIDKAPQIGYHIFTIKSA